MHGEKEFGKLEKEIEKFTKKRGEKQIQESDETVTANKTQKSQKSHREWNKTKQ